MKKILEIANIKKMVALLTAILLVCTMSVNVLATEYGEDFADGSALLDWTTGMAMKDELSVTWDFSSYPDWQQNANLPSIVDTSALTGYVDSGVNNNQQCWITDKGALHVAGSGKFILKAEENSPFIAVIGYDTLGTVSYPKIYASASSTDGWTQLTPEYIIDEENGKMIAYVDGIGEGNIYVNYSISGTGWSGANSYANHKLFSVSFNEYPTVKLPECDTKWDFSPFTSYQQGTDLANMVDIANFPGFVSGAVDSSSQSLILDKGVLSAVGTARLVIKMAENSPVVATFNDSLTNYRPSVSVASSLDGTWTEVTPQYIVGENGNVTLVIPAIGEGNCYVQYKISGATWSNYGRHKLMTIEFNAFEETVCTHEYDNCVDTDCNLCGETREAPGHTYGEWEVTTPAKPGVPGVQEQRCECGDVQTGEIEAIPLPVISAKSLTLESNLSINFKVDKTFLTEYKYTNIYLKVYFNDSVTILRDYEIEVKAGKPDRLMFTFNKVAANMMGDIVTVAVYGEYEGEEYYCSEMTYSVLQYAQTLLNKGASGTLLTLLVDLLNYGSYSQLYNNYKIDALPNAILTEAQKAAGTTEDRNPVTVKNKEYETIANPTAEWNAAGLVLDSAITVRYKFTAADIEGLKVVVNCQGEDYTIDSSKFEAIINKENQYYVYFAELHAAQLSVPLYARIYKDDVLISNTYRYSVESYVEAQDEADSTQYPYLADLVKAMLKFGDSAKAYVDSFN